MHDFVHGEKNLESTLPALRLVRWWAGGAGLAGAMMLTIGSTPADTPALSRLHIYRCLMVSRYN